MSDTFRLRCHVQGDNTTFSVPVKISSTEPSQPTGIDDLKEIIHEKSRRLFTGFDAKDLILNKVNVNLVGILAKIAAGEYQPTLKSLNDKVLCASSSISTEWPEPPHNGHLHIFVRVPGAEGSPTLLQVPVGSQLLRGGAHSASSRHLWSAITIKGITQGRFSGVDGLEHNQIAEMHDEPDFIMDFRNKLAQRRWIENNTEPAVLVLKNELPGFHTYFQDAPTAGGQRDRVSTKLQLWHFTGAFLDEGWSRDNIREDNVRWIFDKLSTHLQSVLGSRTQDGFRTDWPLTLIVSVESEQKEYRYTPRSYFQLSVNRLVSLLVEVQSDKNEGDRYRMLLHAACMARLGRLFYKDLFIVVALYIENSGRVTRYLVFQPDGFDRRVSYISDVQNWMQPSKLFTAIFELYNLISVMKHDRPKLETMEREVVLLNEELSANFNDTFMSKRTCDTSDDGARPNKRFRPSRGPRGGRSNTGNGSHLAEHVYYDREVADTFAQAGYTLDLDDEEETGLAPLNQLKPTMRYARDKSGTGVIVKRLRPGSDELLILQHLHSIDSPNNHTIPLLQAFNLDNGTFFFVLEGTPLDYGFVLGRFSSNNIVNFSQQLVEGVAFLHGHSIAHLDIKPSNIVVRRNRLFIIDFDISVRVDGPDTMIDRWRGTPRWMAPEIEKNQDGPRCSYSPIRADLWSCGLVLEYLAGEGAGEENPYEVLTRDLLNTDPRRRPLLDVRSDYGKVSADDMMTDDRSCRTVFLA